MHSYDDREDMITCPDCGHREYPEVGFSTHFCPASATRHGSEEAAFEAHYFGSRRVVRTAVVIEHYDTDDCFTMALGSVQSRLPHTGGDPLLGFHYVVVREAL